DILLFQIDRHREHGIVATSGLLTADPSGWDALRLMVGGHPWQMLSARPRRLPLCVRDLERRRIVITVASSTVPRRASVVRRGEPRLSCRSKVDNSGFRRMQSNAIATNPGYRSRPIVAFHRLNRKTLGGRIGHGSNTNVLDVAAPAARATQTPGQGG